MFLNIYKKAFLSFKNVAMSLAVVLMASCFIIIPSTPSLFSNTYISIKQDSSFQGGSGSEFDPFQIRTGGQLSRVRGFSAKYFILLCNLDLSAYSFSSIPSFYGNFNGNGFTIKIGELKSVGDAGIFATTSGAEIKNLSVSISTYNAVSGSNVGSIVGYAQSGTEIIGCNNFSGDVNVNGTINSIGGIVGKASASIIENCNNSAKFRNGSFKSKTDAQYAGGIVGLAEGSTQINNCTNYGFLNHGNARYAGGITGKGGQITKCVNLANLILNTTYAGAHVGGLTGWTDKNVSTCYNDADVSFNSSDYFTLSNYISGCVGYSTGTISNCANYGNITTNLNGKSFFIVLGGIVAYSSGIVSNCYNSGSITITETELYNHDNSYFGGMVGCANRLSIDDVVNYGKINFPSTKMMLSDFEKINVGTILGGGSMSSSSNLYDYSGSGILISEEFDLTSVNTRNNEAVLPPDIRSSYALTKVQKNILHGINGIGKKNNTDTGVKAYQGSYSSGFENLNNEINIKRQHRVVYSYNEERVYATNWSTTLEIDQKGDVSKFDIESSLNPKLSSDGYSVNKVLNSYTPSSDDPLKYFGCYYVFNAVPSSYDSGICEGTIISYDSDPMTSFADTALRGSDMEAFFSSYVEWSADSNYSKPLKSVQGIDISKGLTYSQMKTQSIPSQYNGAISLDVIIDCLWWGPLIIKAEQTVDRNLNLQLSLPFYCHDPLSFHKVYGVMNFCDVEIKTNANEDENEYMTINETLDYGSWTHKTDNRYEPDGFAW